MNRLAVAPRRLWSQPGNSSRCFLRQFLPSPNWMRHPLQVTPARGSRRPLPTWYRSSPFHNSVAICTRETSSAAAEDRDGPSSSTATGGAINEAQACYDEALQALKRAEQLEQENERQKSEEMYRAWQKSAKKQEEYDSAKNMANGSTNIKNNKSNVLQGVAVVKTIVKQTRRAQKQQQLHNKIEAPSKDNDVLNNGEDGAEFWKQKGEELLRHSALVHNHPRALILLGNQELQSAKAALMQGDTTRSKHTVTSAVNLYRRAGMQGAPEGWFNVGQLLWTGYPDTSEGQPESSNEDVVVILEPNHIEAMDAFRKAIDLGDADAMYFVGVTVLSSEDEDNGEPKEGLELIQNASRLGHGPARYYMALLHLNGNEALQIAPCKPKQFVQYLETAVDAGSPDALLLRGHSYHQGENGYPLNYAGALADFLAAAEMGNADAAVSAGAVLHSGRPGIRRDHTRAFELYQLAGEMGSLDGWRNVVACYALGEGVPKSESTAKYIARTILKEDV